MKLNPKLQDFPNYIGRKFYNVSWYLDLRHEMDLIIITSEKREDPSPGGQ